MSMDISIWSAAKPSLPGNLPQADAWKAYAFDELVSYQFEGSAWVVNVSTEDGDPSADVLERLPAAKYPTGVSLEPIGANEEGYQFLEHVVRALTKACDGLWENLGDGEMYRHDQGPF